MLQMAQEIILRLRTRVCSTIRLVAGIAETFGAPSTVVSILNKVAGEESVCCCAPSAWNQAGVQSSSSNPDEDELGDEAPAAAPPPPEVRGTARKRVMGSEVDLSGQVRMLKAEDEIEGSTYLARIIWCLGVAELDGTGPLRPADIATMILSRTTIQLEPPNVARYIRRSKPASISIAYSDKNSHYYKLNNEGHELFNRMYKIGSN